MPSLQIRTPQELAIELDDGQPFAPHPICPPHFEPLLRRILSQPAHDPRYVAAEN